MNGTMELPIGPNKLLLANSSGWVARAVERWQTSFIFNGSTGSPADALASVNHLYGNSNYNVVNPQWKIPKGEMRWDGPNNNSGTFYGNTFINTLDPQCSTTSVVAATDTMGTNLSASCTLNALALRNSDGTAGADHAGVSDARHKGQSRAADAVVLRSVVIGCQCEQDPSHQRVQELPDPHRCPERIKPPGSRHPQLHRGRDQLWRRHHEIGSADLPGSASRQLLARSPDHRQGLCRTAKALAGSMAGMLETSCQVFF